MKLRIRGNSLRLRLTQSEVANFARQGRIEESIPLGEMPGHCLGYVLVTDKSAAALSVSFEHGVISVLVPEVMAASWAGSEEVGLYGEQAWGAGRTVRLSVEKDFQCLDKRHGEIISDAYPHPAKPGTAKPDVQV